MAQDPAEADSAAGGVCAEACHPAAGARAGLEGHSRREAPSRGPGPVAQHPALRGGPVGLCAAVGGPRALHASSS
eukprot:4333853-Alexandrium_andersonii.AAC.1